MKTYISYLLGIIPARVFSHIYYFLFIKFRLQKRYENRRIFVLDSFRFREDLEVLVNKIDIGFIDFPYWMQDKVDGFIIRSKIKDKESYFSDFIAVICGLSGSIGFVSSGMYYKRHEKWERGALSANKKFFCLHREGVGMDVETLQNSYSPGLVKSRKFCGSKLMVATEPLKKLLVDVGYIESDKVVVTGLPRFDKIFDYNSCNKKNEEANGDRSGKRLLLFSFFVGTVADFLETGLYPENDGFRNLFDNVHSSVANYAITNPDVEVVIKMKWYQGDAKENVDNAIYRGSGMAVDDISNLSIVDNVSAQELILWSDVVVAFNSTTLVESLLYNKFVILPIFDEAVEKEFLHYVSFLDYSDNFYVADSVDEMANVIQNCMDGFLEKKIISEELIKETIGFYDGKVCDRIQNVLLS